LPGNLSRPWRTPIPPAPNCTSIWAYTYLHLGAAEGSAGQYAAALRDLRKAASMVALPQEVRATDHHLVDAYLKIRDQLAAVLLRTGNRGAAIQALREAVAAARNPAAIAPRRLAEMEAKLAAAARE
jgi:tetratricopeptide (TPR) repeat protein